MLCKLSNALKGYADAIDSKTLKQKNKDIGGGPQRDRSRDIDRNGGGGHSNGKNTS